MHYLTNKAGRGLRIGSMFTLVFVSQVCALYLNGLKTMISTQIIVWMRTFEKR